MSQQHAQAVAQVQRLLSQGATLLEQGEAKTAIPLLERAYDVDARNVPVLINLGAAYALTGRHAEAVPLLETARDLEPDNPMIWINLGAAYLGNPVLASGEEQMRAIAAFQKALELDAAAPNVHYNIGLILADRAEPDLAMAAFRQAIRVNPADRDARHWLDKLEAGKEREQERES
jgi:tetratricopeptide (TPR) repeat protein